MSNFVDECGLNVRGGDGGAGCVAFRREAHVPMGGPDGGDGGNGGDVWLQADRNVASLLAFRDHPHRRAENGTHGSGKRKHGHAGADMEVHVPVGTTIRDRDGEILADLTNHGDRWLAAEGGIGGKGNSRFLSNRRRAPDFAEQGEKGDERWLRLELRLMADVALVGFPNVGKSTLISRISAAKPRIADYPFTTLEPNLGVVRMGDGADAFEMVVADIPGLIEGAAEGRGLGHQFLRHIERSRVLAVLIDLSPFAPASPEEQLATLLNELESYQPDLLDRPRLIVGSRSDVADESTVGDFDGLVISAVTGQGLNEMLTRLRRLLEEARENTLQEDEVVILRPVPQGISISRYDDGSFVVEGREAIRAVRFSDLTNPAALEVAMQRLSRLGVEKALARAGARTGSVIHIGDFSFDYEADDALQVQPFDEAEPTVVESYEDFDDFDDLDDSDGLDDLDDDLSEGE
ncbi:MAG: GTPase ObgE [Microthrixaceae bacterium]|nr:GTPase ObgE [Microthrixaceae bacterium]